MNCNYRILKDVHIGLRVRKTKDKNTVPFKNDPMTGVKIISWSQLGFQLSHPDLPKDIWVDFHQLPLDKIQLEYGVIKNPITFVEQVMVGGSMVLVRADTLDYMEMLHDKKEKEDAPVIPDFRTAPENAPALCQKLLSTPLSCKLLPPLQQNHRHTPGLKNQLQESSRV